MPDLPEKLLTPHLSEDALAKLRKTYIDETYFDDFIEPNVIYKDAVTGKPQMLWLTNVIPLELQAQALSVFQHKSIATAGTAAYRESAAGPHPGRPRASWPVRVSATGALFAGPHRRVPLSGQPESAPLKRRLCGADPT